MTEILPLSKRVKFTKHAVARIIERLNQPEFNAENYVRQLLATATYLGESSNYRSKADVYSHKKTGVTIVVSQSEDAVITVYKADEQPQPSTPKLTLDNFVQAIKREYKRMSTQTQREIRRLSEQQAELGVVLAQLTLNQVRCDAPHTKALLQSRINELKAQVEAIATEINVKSTQIEAASKEVQAVVGR